MSGLSNEPRSNGKFVNFKDGNLINDGKTFSHLTGIIKDLKIAPETYNDKEYQKVTLYIDADGFIYQLGFPMVSGYGIAFFNMVNNIDFSKPVKISGGSEKMDNSDKKWGKMFIQQDGKYVTWYYKKGTKEHDKIPAVETVKVGRENVKNYEKRDEFVERVLTNAYAKKIQKAWPKGVSDAVKKEQQLDPAAGITEPIDDLPF